MKTKIQIQINNGSVSVTPIKINKKKCRWCGQEIYIIKTSFDKSILATKNGENFISHLLTCSKLNQKNYETKNWFKNLFRKNKD